MHSRPASEPRIKLFTVAMLVLERLSNAGFCDIFTEHHERCPVDTLSLSVILLNRSLYTAQERIRIMSVQRVPVEEQWCMSYILREPVFNAREKRIRNTLGVDRSEKVLLRVDFL